MADEADRCELLAATRQPVDAHAAVDKRLTTLAVGCALSDQTSSKAFCTNILGIVSDPQGNGINGCLVNVTDSSGKVVRDGRSDLYGRYCIPAVDPGTYTLVLETTNCGVQTGSGVVNLPLEGATVDWSVAKDKPAVASTTPGIVSKAAATCGAAWWENPAVAATAFAVTGGGVVGALCGFDVICGGGGSSGPVSGTR